MGQLKNRHGTVEPINAHTKLDAAATVTAGHPRLNAAAGCLPAALAVTNQKVGRAYSPIVIAGAVRVIDFIMLSAIGIALYFAYAVPLERILTGNFSRRSSA